MNDLNQDSTKLVFTPFHIVGRCGHLDISLSF